LHLKPLEAGGLPNSGDHDHAIPYPID
jgi:hypothetical protein